VPLQILFIRVDFVINFDKQNRRFAMLSFTKSCNSEEKLLILFVLLFTAFFNCQSPTVVKKNQLLFLTINFCKLFPETLSTPRVLDFLSRITEYVLSQHTENSPEEEDLKITLSTSNRRHTMNTFLKVFYHSINLSRLFSATFKVRVAFTTCNLED